MEISQLLGDGSVKKAVEPGLLADLDKSRQRIIKHMNEDHGDSCLVYLRHYAKLPNATKGELKDMSSEGLTIDATLEDGEVKAGVFVPFTRQLEKASDIRPIVVDMHHEAYHALGVGYKLKEGYYKRQIQMHSKVYRKNRKVQAAALVGLTAVCIASIWKMRQQPKPR